MSAKIANWEWKDDNDFWTPYYHADNTLIEAAFKSGQQLFSTKSLSFNAEHQSVYVYDFTRLTQKNQDSGRVRKLRRIESSATEDEEGFVAALGHTMSFHFGGHVGSAVAPPAPVIPVVVATASTSSSTDEPVSKKPRFEFPGLAVGAFPVPPPPAPAVAEASFPHMAPSAAVPSVPAFGGFGFPAMAAAVGPTPTPAPAPPITPASSAVPAVDPLVTAAQTALGAQSRRNQKYDLGPVAADPHGKNCFDQMLYREKQLCGDFGVFYHSYSLAALLYEVQAAVAAVLFRFKSEWATLPRLLKQPYNDLPDAASLLKLFPKMPTRDHDPRFRAVAISATSSLLAPDSEAPPKSVFLSGYSCSDLSFVGVLEGLLVSCGVPDSMKTALGKKIVELCSIHGLDASQFKGKPCKSGRAGHMLQIFVKRSLVDTYVYPAHPFGVFDTKRPVLSKYLEGHGPISGQIRIVTNPSVFMRGNAVRMYVFSADPTFHANRAKFQKELSELLHPIIGTSATRVAAARGIYAGTLPAWFNPDDQEEEKKKTAAAGP